MTPKRILTVFLGRLHGTVGIGPGLYLPCYQTVKDFLKTIKNSCEVNFFSYICKKQTAHMKRLTKKEEVIMNHFWEKGPLFVRELRELYPDPKPHFSTLSTQVRTLQEEGFIDHKAYGPTYQYYAKVSREDYKQRSLIGLIDKYFDNSYMSAVSALVKEEKISVEELKELIDLVEKGK